MRWKAKKRGVWMVDMWLECQAVCRWKEMCTKQKISINSVEKLYDLAYARVITTVTFLMTSVFFYLFMLTLFSVFA